MISSSSLSILSRRVRNIHYNIHNNQMCDTTGITTTISSFSLCHLRKYNTNRMMLQQKQLIYLCMILLSLLFLLPNTILAADTATSINQNQNNNHNNIDLFDQFDMNHDTMIDRNEYNIGITNFINQLQFNTQPSLQSSSQSSSFTSWLLHDIFSYPKSPTTSSSSEQSIGGSTTATTDTSSGSGNGNTVGILSIWHGFWNAFTSSVAMILATEIGDKTFFIAAILSMKHSRSIIFIGSILALIIMTIISTGMGLILPKLLDRKYTHILSGILFLYFGIKLIYDSSLMEHGKVSEELEEVEEELLHPTNKTKKMLFNNKKKGDDDDINNTNDVEAGNSTNSNNNKKSLSSSSSNHTLMMNQLSTTYTIIMMAFTLTFVAEWGDRSQIATIALASSKNPIGVTIGSIIGHCCCTASACIGGRILASNISEKTVSQYGGIIFLLFGFHSLLFEK